MSAAATSSVPRSPSTRRSQGAAYNAAPDHDRPHRTQSTNHRSGAPSSPRRSASASQSQTPTSHTRTPSANLERVARQDFEQTNLARPGSSRKSEVHDRPNDASSTHPPRSDSRAQPGHARTQSRYTDQPTPAPSTQSGVTTTDSRSLNPNQRRRTAIDAQTGHWELGKTVGAGSMGKVKLARNKETGETVAVKIVPRQSTEEYKTEADKERADRSKEVRTAREAAIMTLVDHPYICGMRDVLRTNYHWYMLCEYVNGGQMLDYIISHGRLKEKQARKFGRQIASALDYCHRNSIVHRDLKIENILISKTGDIKIIDFGLSNLFSPRGHLKTFCGSLYFAAPELLQAKQYTGPEVDVWSFGIVLYVLVCGKVPFDDQSMPQLHAKIKKGVVDYPPWLTPECKSLISRMLTTNPVERASLQEIMNHPWMTKGFSGPPENYLSARKALQMPLDHSVIEKMTGFDFGDQDIITAQLTKIVESDEYQRAIRLAERRSYQQVQQDTEQQKRGVFNFYKRRSSTTSRDTLNTPSTEAIQLGSDPLNAFHPLLSVYYLAMEKQEREAREKNPGALAMPQSPGEKPIKIPDLPAPEAAYTNSSAYEMAGEKPTGGRSRPRARTHGEDEVAQGIKGMNIYPATAASPRSPAIIEPPSSEKPPGHGRKESAAAGLLRRFSTRRQKDTPERERAERPPHPPPSLAVHSPSETPRKSFSMRRTRDREASQTREPPPAALLRPETAGSKPQHADLLVPPSSAGDASSEKSSKRSHGIGRSVSVNSSDLRRRLSRRGASESSKKPAPPLPGSSAYEPAGTASDVETAVRPQTSAPANRARSMGHARKGSMQARRAQRLRTAEGGGVVPEETEEEILEEEGGRARVR